MTRSRFAYSTCTYTASGNWCGDCTEHTTEPPALTADDARRAWIAYAQQWHADHGDTYYLCTLRYDTETHCTDIIDTLRIDP